MKWINVSEKMPSSAEDFSHLYVVEYGKVRDDVMWSEYGIKWDTCHVPPRSFVKPNSDPEYGGLFRSEGVTHWAHKTLPPLPDCLANVVMSRAANNSNGTTP